MAFLKKKPNVSSGLKLPFKKPASVEKRKGKARGGPGPGGRGGDGEENKPTNGDEDDQSLTIYCSDVSQAEDSTLSTDESAFASDQSTTFDFAEKDENDVAKESSRSPDSPKKMKMKMQRFKVKNQQHQLRVEVAEHGSAAKMQLKELDYVPKPNEPNEVVVKVDCSTVTLQDCMVRRGKWHEMQELPFVPGSDLVGTVHAMGDEAASNSTFKVGDRVAAVVPSGGNAKYISLPYRSIIRVPAETDSDVALCLSSAYVPAREALDQARKRNMPFTSANVLVVRGNDPTGIATIELALLEGANVFATADKRHHDFLTNLGAKCFPIDPDEWLPSLKGKMDVVLDSVCLDGYESSRLALNPSGTLVCTGMSAVYMRGQIRGCGIWDVRDYKAMYCKVKAKYLLTNAVYYDRMERYDSAQNEYAQHFRYLCHLAAKGSINPLVSTRGPLNMVASMQKAIEHGDTTYGVCVCTPWSTEAESSSDDRKFTC